MEKLNLPKKIKILYRDYSVCEYCDKKAATEGRFGSCDNNEAIIYVDTKWDENKVGNTFLHEILHAISFVMALEPKDFECDEDMVHPMSNGLATVMRDNPEIFQFILSALKTK